MSDLKKFTYGVSLVVNAVDERAAASMVLSLYDDIHNLIGEGITNEEGSATILPLPVTPKPSVLTLIACQPVISTDVSK